MLSRHTLSFFCLRVPVILMATWQAVFLSLRVDLWNLSGVVIGTSQILLFVSSLLTFSWASTVP